MLKKKQSSTEKGRALLPLFTNLFQFLFKIEPPILFSLHKNGNLVCLFVYIPPFLVVKGSLQIIMENQCNLNLKK